MAYNDEKMKLDSSQRDLNEKFKNDIEDKEAKIYWYIKFSLPLDEHSVSKKTMKVTDTKGYILKTNIIYNKSLELIVIESLESYKEEEYYILRVSKEVKTENLKPLKRDVNILFKIKGGEVSEFKELSENIIVPKPRNKKIVRRKEIKARVYTEKIQNKINNVDLDKLPYSRIKFNPIIAIGGIPLFVLAMFLNNNIILGIGSVLVLLGFFHIIFQITSYEFRSMLNYNLGVINFNKEKYKKAERKFKKAVRLNSHNELAEYGLNKVSFFI